MRGSEHCSEIRLTYYSAFTFQTVGLYRCSLGNL